MDYTKKYISILEKTNQNLEDKIRKLSSKLLEWEKLGRFEEVAFNYVYAGKLVKKLAEDESFLEIMSEVMEEYLLTVQKQEEENWFNEIMEDLNLGGNSFSEGNNDTGE